MSYMKKTLIQDIQTLSIMGYMDLKLRYQNSALGFLWSFLKPLLQFTVYYIIFGKVLHVGSGNEYALRLFLGVLIWAWFSESTNNGLNTFINKKQIVTKIKINKLIPIYAAYFTSTINFLLNFMVFLIIYLIFMYTKIDGINLQKLLLFFYSFACLSISIICLNILLAVINIFFRDLQQIWEIVLMYGIFVTPVIYQLPIPKQYEVYYYSINILAMPLQNLRSVFFSSQLSLIGNIPIMIGYHIMLAFMILLSMVVYNKYAKHVVDYL